MKVKCSLCGYVQEHDQYALTDNEEHAKRVGKQCIKCGWRGCFPLKGE